MRNYYIELNGIFDGELRPIQLTDQPLWWLDKDKRPINKNEVTATHMSGFAGLTSYYY